MNRFFLVDLWSQYAYIPAEVRALPRTGFLAWLRQFGEVLEWRIDMPPSDNLPEGLHTTGTAFRSACGPQATFEITESGELFLYFDMGRLRAW
jgi:hypothetical protein